MTDRKAAKLPDEISQIAETSQIANNIREPMALVRAKTAPRYVSKRTAMALLDLSLCRCRASEIGLSKGSCRRRALARHCTSLVGAGLRSSSGSVATDPVAGAIFLRLTRRSVACAGRDLVKAAAAANLQARATN